MKPCPFCASRDVKSFVWIVFEGRPAEHRECALVCQNCGAEGPNDLSYTGAEEAWNMRRSKMPGESLT